jgi:hypothetical protein
MRTLLRVVVLGGLVAVGWLLEAGTGHADEDPGLPGSGLIHIVNAATFDGGSSGRAGAQTAVGRTVTRVLSAASAPQLPIEPPVKADILRPIVDTVGLPTPLNDVLAVLAPVSRPLSGTAPHSVTSQLPAQDDLPATADPPTAPGSAPAASTASVHTAVLTLAPLRHAAPPVPVCSFAQLAVEPVIVQPALGDDVPVDPIPASPPGSGSSACLVNGTGSSASSKNAPDVAVQNGEAMAHPASPNDLSFRGTSDLPPSLSARPSTSPD